MNNLRSLMSAMLLALAFAAPSVRAADETPNPWKFEFHGFVTASMYYQDQVFANAQGQGLWLAAPTNGNRAPAITAAPLPPCGPNTTNPTTPVPNANPSLPAGNPTPICGSATKSGSILGGDLRNSRFAFSMAGPKVFDGAAQPRAYLEFDFFGINGAGAYATEQQVPRLRVGYAELKFGGTNVQVGQQNQLVVVQIPGSISHIANPVTYQAGTIGWRTPGIRVTQTIPIDDVKLEFAGEAVKNKWSREAQLTGTTANPTAPNLIGEGEASGLPMFQVRGKVDGKVSDLTYMAYVVYVYHQVQLDGFGGSLAPPPAAAGKTTLTGNAIEGGGKLTYNITPSNPISLAGNYYQGVATGGMLGSMVYFGDIQDTGYWVSAAGNLTKELQLTFTYGANSPDKADVRAWAGNTARLANTMMGGMIKYQDGGYALGVEGYQLETTYSATAATEYTSKAMQVIATAAYFF